MLETVELFQRITEQINNNCIEGVKNNERNIRIILQRIHQIEKQVQVIGDTNKYEPICMFKEVIYDLYTSVYLAVTGFYRTAYLNARSAMELGLGSIYFVDRIYYFWQWKIDMYDIRWSRLTDSNEGIVSKGYISMFNKEMSDPEIVKLINEPINTYRKCSQYVHGKFDFMQMSLSEQICFNQEEFEKWIEVINQVIEILSKYIEIRFWNELKNIQ